jgi:hypothetical protein
MSAVTPFEAANLPAHLAAFADIGDDDLTSNVGQGYPILRIKGKVFSLTRDGETKILMKPDAEDEPAQSLEVVILKANPSLSKTYYAAGYEEGSSEKPDCSSEDGVVPDADATSPQATKCSLCVHNQFGSKISENGSRGKACADVRRIAIAPAGQLNDPMLLRIPAGSLKPLAAYGDSLKKRGIKYPSMITKIGFDHTVAYPLLTFKPTGFVDAASVPTVIETLQSDAVAKIVAIKAPAAALPAPTTAAAPVAPPVAAAPVTPPPAPAPVQAAPAPTPTPAKAVKPKPTAPVVDMAALDDQLGALLAGAGFAKTDD